MKKKTLLLLTLAFIVVLTAIAQGKIHAEPIEQVTTTTTTQAITNTTTTRNTNVTTITITETSPTTIFATTTIPVFFSYTTTRLATVVMGLEPHLAILLTMIFIIIALLVGYAIGLKTRRETAPPPVQPKPAKKARI
ncbi:MAG: hypothetical protein QW348_01570 [Ignisphaera sp.]